MESDVPLGKLFQENPDQLADLLGVVASPGAFRVSSQEFKDIQRTADCILEHPDLLYALLVELQNYGDPYIYYRASLERTLCAMHNPEKKIYMVVVFFDASQDPKTEPYYSLAQAGNPYYRVVYLKELLVSLEKREPGHPLVAVLAPLVVESDAQLLEEAAGYHEQLRNLQTQDPNRHGMLDVFESLIFSRFKNISKEELMKMLVPLAPITESRAYKEIFAEGKVEGRLEELDLLLADGIIDEKTHGERTRELRQQLALLEADED